MSHYYLCAHCKCYDGQSGVAGDMIYCTRGGDYGSYLTRAKVMVDHGPERGHMEPYDNPLDVCPNFVRKEDK